MDQKNIIQLQDISFSRGKNKILNRFNWSTVKGQHWFVLGNNGSGKTTLLEILMGFLWPQEGHIFICGNQYGHTCLPELRKRIGYVSTWIFRRMHRYYSIERVIASGVDASLSYFGKEDEALRKKVRLVAEKFFCDHLLEKIFGELSSGEQFKVILSRAFINRPDLLILDEPFSALDIGSRQRSYQLLEKVAKSSTSPQIVLVTHHLEDIQDFYTHGMIIDQGVSVYQGRREGFFETTVFKEVFQGS